jgi:hypothetical protein
MLFVSSVGYTDPAMAKTGWASYQPALALHPTITASEADDPRFILVRAKATPGC